MDVLFEKILKFSLSCLTLKMVSIFQKITLTPFEFSNFSWKTDKLNLNFCRKKKLGILALKSDKNARRYLKSVLGQIFSKKKWQNWEEGSKKFSRLSH